MEMQSYEKRVLASRAWRAFSRRVVVPWLISYADLPPETDVLKLGAGAGADAEALAERFPGWRLTATDFDPEMVEMARPRGASPNSSRGATILGTSSSAAPSATVSTP